MLARLEVHSSVVGGAIAGVGEAFGFKVIDGFDVEGIVELSHLVFVWAEEAEVVEVHGASSKSSA